MNLGRDLPRSGLADLISEWSLCEGEVRLRWPRWHGFLDRPAFHSELTRRVDRCGRGETRR